MKKIITRLVFLIVFLLSSYYTLFIETEKFDSSTSILIKNISKDQTLSALGAILAPDSSSASQDSNLLELYLRSYDVYSSLDKEFNLSRYYTSATIDPIDRLYSTIELPFLAPVKENLLKKYNQDFSAVFDQPSSTLKIAFRHADALTAKAIIDRLLILSSHKLNNIEKENSKVVLELLKRQAQEKQKVFMNSIKKLIEYQNRHNTIDPSIDVEQKTKLMANLEAVLVQKEIEYKSLLKQKRPASPSMKVLRSTIAQTKQKLNNLKREISGKNNQTKLNVDVFDFEILKNEMGFNKELYKQTLLKLEETKVNINKLSKNIIVITTPTVAQSYSEPNKFMSILNLTIVLVFLYSIISLLFRIIRSHRD